jgi:two-component system NtrC family sensor kinase
MNGIWKKKVDEKTKLVKDAEAQIVHMEKMASLGTLAAGIAHEINNPLGFLISNLQSLKDYTQQIEGKISLVEKENKVLIEDMKAMNQESLDGAVRIKKIVSDLRTFSRRSETQNSLVEINQVLESVLSIVWNEIKYKVTVIKDYQAKSKISADTTQLSQVFLNLLINASQAIVDKGTITMSTYEDAKSVYVKVVDTGSGIAKDVLPKIFDPFFSTKKSTGLGLSVSYNIIKHHGGDVKVESTVGAGTTFVVQLPRAPQG